MRKTYWVAILLTMTSVNAWAASGIVYEDPNGISARDAGAPGIGDVRASDGLNIAVTDTEGRWSPEIADEADEFGRTCHDRSVPEITGR